MGKEELLNLLDPDARVAFEAAERLALTYGGAVTPLHLVSAIFQCLPPLPENKSRDAAQTISARLNQVLASEHNYRAESILVTRETQSVLRQSWERAGAARRDKANIADLLAAAVEAETIRRCLERDSETFNTLRNILATLASDSTRSPDTGTQTSPKEFYLDATERAGEAGQDANGVPHGAASRAQSPCLTGALAEFCEDLTGSDHPHPFIGREREVTAVLETLCRKLKNNPLLVGKPGVGKTALVGAVAARLRDERVPARLRGKRIFEVSRIKLLADARYAGEIEERLKRLLEETHAAGDVILFFDELHTLLGAGGAAGTGDVASLLKSALSRGDVTSIGATTQAEYYRYIAKDEALARRFSTITIEEPSSEATFQILQGTRSTFEAYHAVAIDDEALQLIVEIAGRYLPSRSFPDKAFDLMDNAAAKAAMSGRERLGRPEIIEALSEMTGLPLEIMDQDQGERLQHLEEYLNEAVPGQNVAAHDVARVVGIAKLGLEIRPETPDGVFLFVGAEGAGKREMATALAEFLYGSPQKLIEFDMSQFAQGWSMSRLVGAEPGYVGYGERSGLFTKAAEDHPHSVFLFRNIDLANTVIQQFLAEAFDQGRFTDAAGTQVSISNITVVLTLSRECEGARTGPLGFVSDPHIDLRPHAAHQQGWARYRIIDALGATIDEVIEFRSLDRAATEKIIAARLDVLRRRVASAQAVSLRCDSAITGFLADRLAAEKHGLAHLDRLMQELILAPLSSLCSNHGHSGVSADRRREYAGGSAGQPADQTTGRAVAVLVEEGKIRLLPVAG